MNHCPLFPFPNSDSSFHIALFFNISFKPFSKSLSLLGLPCWLSGKESANAGDTGSISGWERFPREGNGNPLQFSCLRNPMGRGAWWATVMGCKKVEYDLAFKQHQPLTLPQYLFPKKTTTLNSTSVFVS